MQHAEAAGSSEGAHNRRHRNDLVVGRHESIYKFCATRSKMAKGN